MRCGVKGEGLKKLLRGPFRVWMFGDIAVHVAVTLVSNDNTDIEEAEGDCGNGEKSMGASWGVWCFKRVSRSEKAFGLSQHVFGNSGLRNPDAELQQFLMDSRVSPCYTGSVHFSDEFRVS